MLFYYLMLGPDGSLLGPSEDEIKDDQWMGVTLKSQGEGGDILVRNFVYLFCTFLFFRSFFY